MFNHWFTQGTIPGSVTKAVIILRKKGDRHVWKDLDNYRPITLLNTELKILTQVLENRLHFFISDFIGLEQNYTVKGRSIQENLHLVREVLEGLKDGTKAALINLDQYKAFNRVDHRFLVTVLETARFKPESCKWTSIIYCNPQVNRKCLEAFTIEHLIQQGYLLSPLLYVLALEPLLCRLRDEKASPALRCILFAGPLLPKVSVYADDITVFVSCRLDIKAVKKVVARYEQIAGGKLNFDKSKGLQLGAWRGGDFLPGPFCWSDGPPTGVKLVGGIGQGRCPGGYLASKAVVLKGPGRYVHCVHLLLDPCQYFLCLGIISWLFNDPSPNYFRDAEGQWSVDRSVVNVRVMAGARHA